MALSREDPGPQELAELRDMVETGIRYEPLEPRLYALGGYLEKKLGSGKDQAYFSHALDLSATERLALSQRFFNHVEEQDYAAAAVLADIIYVRWPQEWNVIAPLLPSLMSQQKAYDELLSRFANRKNGILWLVRSVLEQDNSVGLAYRMVKDAQLKFGINVDRVSDEIIDRLIKADQYTTAYLLFFRTLTPEEKTRSGYVFNSSFTHKPISNFFDWWIKAPSGMSYKFARARSGTSLGSDLERSGGLELNFLNSPVKFNNLVQLLHLPQSQFQLSLSYSNDGFKGPKPLKVQVQCYPKGPIVFEQELSNKDERNLVLKGNFAVPTSGCDMQRIRFLNDNLVESWRNRFSGRVTLHNVSISALDGS